MRPFLALLVMIGLIGCSQIKLLPSKPANKAGDLQALEEGEELAKVNNMSIRQGYLDLLSRLNPRVKAQLANPAAKSQMLNNLVEQEIMYQESIRRGLDQRQDVKEKTALYQRVIIAQSLLEDEMEKKAQEYYEAHKADEFTKVKISQIQFNFAKAEDEAAEKNPSEPVAASIPATAPADSAKAAAASAHAADPKAAALSRAQEAHKRIVSGEDFAKVAEEVSDDKISKRKGGEMGAIGKNDKRMERLGLEKLTITAFNLKNGDVSEPIETEKGYHIIKVTSEPEIVAFDEAKKIVQFQIQKQVRDDLLNSLKEKAKISYKEAPAAPQAPELTLPGSPEAPAAAPAPSPAPTAAPDSAHATPPAAEPQAPAPAPEHSHPKAVSPDVPQPKIIEASPHAVQPETTPPNPAPTTPAEAPTTPPPSNPTPVEAHP